MDNHKSKYNSIDTKDSLLTFQDYLILKLHQLTTFPILFRRNYNVMAICGHDVLII